jgi:hypothetical protein
VLTANYLPVGISCLLHHMPTVVADLQCEVRVGHKRENLNAGCYSVCYSIAAMLKWDVF